MEIVVSAVIILTTIWVLVGSLQLGAGRSAIEKMVLLFVIAVPLGLGSCKVSKKEAIATATKQLKKIFDGAKVHFEGGASVGRDGTVKGPKFPNSISLWPAKKCCKQKGGKCRGTDWSSSTWKALSFDTKDPHIFQYQFISNGLTGAKATFTARAVADLNCDGKHLVVEIVGRVDSQLRVIGSQMISVRENVKAAESPRQKSTEKGLKTGCFQRKERATCKKLFRYYQAKKDMKSAIKVMSYLCGSLEDPGTCFLVAEILVRTKPLNRKLTQQYYAMACKFFKRKGSFTNTEKRAKLRACKRAVLLSTGRK